MALKPVEASRSKNIVKFGPVGASGSDHNDKYSWDDRMAGEEGGARQLHDILLQFKYLKNGKHVLSEKQGGNSASRYHAIRFDYPREYLTSIIGSFNYSYVGCYTCITSITFGTNLRTYGPYDSSNKHSASFEFKLENADQFCGFFGTAIKGSIWTIGMYVDSLGTPNIRQKQCGQSVEENENQLVLYSPY